MQFSLIHYDFLQAAKHSNPATTDCRVQIIIIICRSGRILAFLLLKFMDHLWQLTQHYSRWQKQNTNRKSLSSSLSQRPSATTRACARHNRILKSLPLQPFNLWTVFFSVCSVQKGTQLEWLTLALHPVPSSTMEFQQMNYLERISCSCCDCGGMFSKRNSCAHRNSNSESKKRSEIYNNTRT